MNESYVYVKRMDGHRPSYQNIFSEELGLEPISGRIDWHVFWKLISSRRLVFSTIDDNYFSFIFISLIRSLAGMRTVGIFLRPAQCFSNIRIYHHWKRWAFTLLRLIPPISVVTIVPFPLRPEYAQVARDWVHDPQMWDLVRKGTSIPDTPLSQCIQQSAGDRKILCFVGGVSPIKGIDFLGEIARQRPELVKRCLITVAGKVDADSASAIAVLAERGAMIIDRHLADVELESLYGVADMIWACYRPDYDQASGVFGRCVQVGKLSLVRAGALIERYADHVEAPVCALDYGNPGMAAEAIWAQSFKNIKVTSEERAQSAGKMHRSFVKTMMKMM